MPRRKMSFFERLTGTINVDEEEEDFIEDEFPDQQHHHPHHQGSDQEWREDEEEEGQLAVDVYETPSEIVVQTMIGGVRPEDLDVSITREICTISGKREGPRNIARDDYYHQELYWGAFSRKIVLPQEIEPEEAKAVENHGLLIIRLPKIDKDKHTKLEIQSQE